MAIMPAGTNFTSGRPLSLFTAMKHMNDTLRAVHAAYARTNHVMWASATLIFLCIVIVIAVGSSGMWKEKHHHTEWNKSTLYIDFNERVPFKEVLKHKLNLLRQFKKIRRKKSKKKDIQYSEMEQLLYS